MDEDEQTPLQAVGDYAIELTDRLNTEFPDGYDVGEIIIVAEVKPEGGDWEVQTISSDERPYVADAILRIAAASALAQVTFHAEDETDPD